MDKLESEFIPLQQVIELEENSKDHDLGSINTSIDRFGFLERIIINKTTGHLIAGHGRVRTLQQMRQDGNEPPQGIEMSNGDWLVPADYVAVKKKDEIAASIALNRLVELGGWDEPKLVDNLISIAGKDGKGLRGTGFDGDDLDVLIKAYRPELEEKQSRFDQKIPITCPECGHEFTMRREKKYE